MSTVDFAKLVLDEPRNIYYSGQVLKGHLECVVTDPLSYSVINVNFIGEAIVSWTEKDVEEYNGVRRQIHVRYQAQENYFNTMLCISGGMGTVTLPPGKHQVEFQFQIPHTAPSSFIGEKGAVRYKAVAYIEYPDPNKQRDEVEKYFEVVAPLDLNTAGRQVQAPINLDFEEAYSCCCSSDPVSVKVHIPASGFCPGQAIPMTVEVYNESSFEVKKVIFKIVRKECYHSKEPRSDYTPPDFLLESLKVGPILSRVNREYQYRLQVPEFIAPNLENCSIIDVGYFIKITVRLTGCKDDLEDESEICIGLVPLSSLVQNYTHPLQSDLPTAPIPDPSFIMALPVQNAQLPTSAIPDSTAYPNATHNNPIPYPIGGPFPSVAPIAPNTAQSNPMRTLRTGNIGFVLGSSSNPPYPVDNSALCPTIVPPYPTDNPHPIATNNTPYLNTISAPYPTQNPSGINAVPHPKSSSFGAHNTPYPTENKSPYPTENKSPYPPMNKSPYPPENNTPYPPEKNTPYPPENNTPYPPENNTPYPPENKSPYPRENKSPYPVNPPYPVDQPGYSSNPSAPTAPPETPS